MKSNLTSSVAMFPLFGIFADAGASEKVLAKLKQDLIDLADESQSILDLADKENGRDLSDEELATIEENKTKMAKLTKQIEARESLKLAGTSPGRQTAADPNGGTGGRPAGSGGRVQDYGRGGFKSFGEFATIVRATSLNGPGHQVDSRLMAAQTTFGNEASGADGGWAVPPTFRTTIWQKVMDEENLLTRCTPLTTAGNSITIPKDETTPWGTAGIRVYWEAEGNAATASKPALQYTTMRLNKLFGLVPVSDENLDDAPGLESWLMAVAPGRMAAKINTAVVAGTGAGQPLGIIGSPCTISVAKQTSQPADTIYYANIVKMWARMYAPSRRNAIWLINQDAEPQLDQMAFDPAATAGKVPIYLPNNTIAGSPYATLKGRPVVPVQACKTLGDVGDIILADMTQYWALTKGSGVQSDVSIHLYFDQGLTSFRFIFRVNGQPIWGSAITPENGNNTLSCFITLAERA